MGHYCKNVNNKTVYTIGSEQEVVVGADLEDVGAEVHVAQRGVLVSLSGNVLEPNYFIVSLQRVS